MFLSTVLNKNNTITCSEASKAGLLKLMMRALTLTVTPSTTLSENPYLLPDPRLDALALEAVSLSSEQVPIETWTSSKF